MENNLRIAIVDSSSDFVANLLQFVEGRYKFEFTREFDADYVFHSIDGYDVLKYSGVRIFVTGENVTPNFAISDYSMAFDKLEFGDRHCWLPLIKLYRKDYAVLTAPRNPSADVLRQKTGFCAYVMSNTSESADERVRIFELLSEYKQVDSGGAWRNNVGGRVADKHAFQKKYKFVIAFENSSSPGYLTEKFAQAAAADAIPIYWGDPEIGKVFNPRAFVNCHQYESLEDAVAQVIRIDRDDDLCRKMLSEPWFVDGVEPVCLRDETFRDFLLNIFNQELPAAYRRNRSRWGLKFERNLYDMCHRPHVHSYKLLRKLWRKVFHVIFPRRKKF